MYFDTGELVSEISRWINGKFLLRRISEICDDVETDIR